MMVNKESMKKCFVICPIGERGSDIRRRSDLVLNYVIKPVVKELGYIASRSDEDSKPGIITSQIIGHLMSDELIVADLSFGNPNVYYELAVRHMVRKPVVQIIHAGQPIHFDIITQRTIQFDYQDLESVEDCKQKLREQIQSVEKNPMDVDSPISIAIDTKGLIESKNPMENIISRILVTVQNMQQQIDSISSIKHAGWIPSPTIEPTISGEQKGWGRTIVQPIPSEWTRTLVQPIPPEWIRTTVPPVTWKPPVDSKGKEKGKNKK